MTLTDIEELKQQALLCKSVGEIQTLLDDNGEDNDRETAEKIYHAADGIFFLKEENAFLNGKKIACPDCGTSAPDKLLSSAAEVLSDNGKVHFGCCECGTMFEM